MAKSGCAVISNRKIPRCKICGATKILFIDGSWVCDSCEVGGVKSGLIKTGADIANDITSYEAMHEPSLNTKEYGELVGAGWISLSLLKDYIRLRKKILTKGGDAWTELHMLELLLKEK